MQLQDILNGQRFHVLLRTSNIVGATALLLDTYTGIKIPCRVSKISIDGDLLFVSYCPENEPGYECIDGFYPGLGSSELLEAIVVEKRQREEATTMGPDDTQIELAW